MPRLAALTTSPSFFALAICLVATGCPPFDRSNDDDASTPDGTAADGGNSNPWQTSPSADGGTARRDGPPGSGPGGGAGAANGSSSGTGSMSGTGAGAAGGTDDPESGSGDPGGSPGSGAGDPSSGTAGIGGSDDPFGNGGNGGGSDDPSSSDAGVGGGDDPFGPGSGGPGGGGAGGAGSGMGTFGQPPADANWPAPAKFAQWSGRWNGQMNYQVITGTGDNGELQFGTAASGMALRIDGMDYDAATGLGTVIARVAIVECLLSADLNGTIFFGDELSSVPTPILSLQAAGANASGQFLALRANATRSGNVITGTLNLQGVDMLKFPCLQKDMPFMLTRAPR